jgi:hypothetical protein
VWHKNWSKNRWWSQERIIILILTVQFEQRVIKWVIWNGDDALASNRVAHLIPREIMVARSSIFPADGGTRAIQLRTLTRIHAAENVLHMHYTSIGGAMRESAAAGNCPYATWSTQRRALLRCAHTTACGILWCFALEAQSERLWGIHQNSPRGVIKIAELRRMIRRKRNGARRRSVAHLSPAFPRQWFMALVIAADFNENFAARTRRCRQKGTGVL